MQCTPIYLYYDISGSLLYRKRRSYRTLKNGKRKKDYFFERSIDGTPDGRFATSLGEVPKVLYHLPQLVLGVRRGDVICITEGESDTHSAERMGFCSTTSPTGAGSWHDSYSEHLKGADVWVFYDNDPAGLKQKKNIPLRLHGIANSIKVIDLPLKEKGADLSDWLMDGLRPEEEQAFSLAHQHFGPDVSPEEEAAIKQARELVRHVLERKRKALIELAQDTPTWSPPKLELPKPRGRRSPQTTADLADVVLKIRASVNLHTALLEAGAKCEHQGKGNAFSLYFCPFHSNDNTPAMYAKGEVWTCTVCSKESVGVGINTRSGLFCGDVIDLYQYTHSMNFMEAVREMAERNYIELPESFRQKKGKKNAVAQIPSKEQKKTAEAKLTPIPLDNVVPLPKKRKEENQPTTTDFYDMSLDDRIEFSQEWMRENNVNHLVPTGFFLNFPTQDGALATIQLRYNATKDQHIPHILSHTPIWVSALALDIDRYCAAILVQWLDRRKRAYWQVMEIPEIDSGKEAFTALSQKGVAMVPSRKKALCDFLMAHNPPKTLFYLSKVTSKKVRGKWHIAMPHALFRQNEPLVRLMRETNKAPIELENVGIWKPDPDDQLWAHYCFPHIDDALDRGPIYQKRQENLKKFTVYGDFETLSAKEQYGLAIRAVTICTALLAIVRPLTKWKGFALHLYGRSGSGKSSCAQLAASMTGRGSEPGAPDSYLRRWENTSNAIGALAEYHYGIPLFLDELPVDPSTQLKKELGNLVYQLTGGEGKGRCKITGDLARKRNFNTIMISTGEEPFRAVLERCGHMVMEGQMVRMLELEIFRHSWKGKREVDGAKKFSAKDWGFETFLLMSALMEDTQAQVDEMIKQAEEEHDRLIRVLAPIDVGRERILGHFANMIIVGEFCAKHGVLPWEPGYARKLITLAASQAIESRHISEDERIIMSLEASIMKYEHLHLAKMAEDSDGKNIIVQEAKFERFGFLREKQFEGDDAIIALTPDALMKWSGGKNALAVARKLRERGILITSGRNLKKRIRIDDNRFDLYFINRDMLNLEQSDEELTQEEKQKEKKVIPPALPQPTNQKIHPDMFSG